MVKDLLVQSPYQPVRPALWHLSRNQESVFIIKLNPERSTQDALSKIETVFKKNDPTTPFQSSFVDEEFAQKFGNEKRVGTLAAFFAVLAILISCLGLFGLASFRSGTTNQRNRYSKSTWRFCCQSVENAFEGFCCAGHSFLSDFNSPGLV